MPRFLVNDKKPQSKVKVSGIVHNVHLVDGSGSMSGGKFVNAIKGVNEDINAAISSAKDENIDLTLSFYQFSNSRDAVSKLNTKVSPSKVKSYNPVMIGSGTALYDAIGQTISYFIANKKSEDKVLLKIFTDGQENASSTYNAATIRTLIATAEKHHNFTVTFVGTKTDVEYINRNLNIDISNMAVHDNTAEGIASTFKKTKGSTSRYFKNMASGQNVSVNFYSQD